MLRTSLDGRARKNPESEAPRVQPAKKVYPANLKEAAPPKRNPWRCVKAPSSQSEDLPKPSNQAAAVIQNHSTAKGQVLKEDTPLSSRKCHQRSVSHESPASVRENLQTTASCAGESLWNLPFGADISLYAEDKVLHLHRSVVAPKSGWLRDKLLPPHSNGAPVGVFFPGPAKIIGHSLKFMYTDTSHILAILLRASDDWQDRLKDGICGLAMSRQDGMAFTSYLQDALEAAYAHPRPEIVKPLRLALVGFLDVVLPLIFKNPNVVTLLSTPVWSDHSSTIAVDLVEHRRRRQTQGVMATSQELEALFETLSKGGAQKNMFSDGGVPASMQSLVVGDPASLRSLVGGGPLPSFGARRVSGSHCMKITAGSEYGPDAEGRSIGDAKMLVRIRTREGLFVGEGEAPADDNAVDFESDADEESLRDVERIGSRSEANSYSSLDDGKPRERSVSIGDEVDVLDSFRFVSPGAEASYDLSDLLDKAGQDSDSSPKDDDESLRPSDATCVFSSSYTGDAELGGSHGAALTVLHHGPGRTRPLFSWLHLQQHVMSFDDFWVEISQRVRFSEEEKKATTKLRADVKRLAIKSRQNEHGKTVGLMEPLYCQVSLGKAKEEKRAARWICLPYFSLQPYSGLLEASSPASFPSQALLQSQYSRTPRQRDMRQAVCQLGMAPKGHCFHITQMWCLVLDNSLLVTCSSMSQADLCSRSLQQFSQPPQREPGSNGSGRILVSYGSAVQWIFRLFVSRFSAFWPRSLEFRWRDRVVEPGSWPNVLKLASLPRASVLLRLKVITPQADVHKAVLTSQPAATADEAGKSPLKDLHVLTLRPRDSMTASGCGPEVEELRAQLAAAEEFLLSNTSFSQQRAYKSCIGASRKDVLDSLTSQGFEVEVGADDAMQSLHQERVELYGISEMVFNFFLPPDFDGPTTDKFWGSISFFMTTASSRGDDGYARGLRDSLRTASKNIQAFQRIMGHADDQTRATMTLPRQFVTAWLHLLAGVVWASGAQAGWRGHLDKAKDLMEQGMRTMIQAETGRSLVDDSAVLPMEVVSLMAAELLQDRVGREADVIDTYSQFLSSLNTDITTKPSDRSYQHRIELVRQEMAVIERTLSSQRQIIDDIRNAGDSTLAKGITLAQGIHTAKDGNGGHGTDELGFRDLLLAECGRVIEARELELRRLGEYAEELEQDVTYKMGSTKDRQENAIYAFTLVTIIFLPLSAISSIFGMNTNDVRNMASGQWLYWAVALPVTVVVTLAGLWCMGEFGGTTTTPTTTTSEGRRPSRERVHRSRTERRVRRTRTRSGSTF
ncbi:hypothetical protein CP532_5184 [Ophiocordyceps camponoti-leonardi (nom. inval.)]|nr:hypothetical protein CP532_5184 [Ophiocordyceps camponoti-leonardi (nom. inval.)]